MSDKDYKNKSNKTPISPPNNTDREYDEEKMPLLNRDTEDSYVVPPSNTLYRVVSVVGIIFSLFIITIGSAIYKLQQEESVVLRAHESLLTENNEDLCILKKKKFSNQVCPHTTTKFFVPATQEGKWPDGFAFLVYKNDNLSGEKELLFSENGLFDHSSDTINCKIYMSELCLDGDYAIMAKSKIDALETSYVIACDKYRVESGEALNFHAADHCSDGEFSNSQKKMTLQKIQTDLTLPESDTELVMNGSQDPQSEDNYIQEATNFEGI